MRNRNIKTAKTDEDTRYAALYVRVSTDAQFEEGYSVDAQTERLEAYCVSKGIENYKIYVDGGFSGSNILRPRISDIIKDATSKKLSHVIVYKLDRISRSQKDTLYLLEDVFLPNGVDFISLNENLDTSSPYGRAMIGILSAFAQLERETIRERTRMGMQERVKTGLWMGGGRTPFGYDYDKERGILVPNKDAETVKAIYDLYLQGYSCNYIARALGLKYERLAIQILKRKSNCGYIIYNGHEYVGQHEAIIPLETYEQAMEAMRIRSSGNLVSATYLLSGLLYCGKCGAKMRYQKWGKNKCKICCYSQDKSKTHLVKDINCDNTKVWSHEVENTVLEALFELTSQPIDIPDSAEIETTSSLLTSLKEQYDDVNRQLKRLYALYATDDNDMLLETVNERKGELLRLESQISIEEKKYSQTKTSSRLANQVNNLSEVWPMMTKQEQQNIVRQCIERITLTDGVPKIFFSLALSS